MEANNENDILFDDASFLTKLSGHDNLIKILSNNDCDCSGYTSTSNIDDCDTNQITSSSGQTN